MAKQKEKKGNLRNRLRVKYRLVVMNEETFKEKASLLLTPMNVIIFGGSLAIFLIVLVTYIIAFTPLREYIPGYADTDLRLQVYENTLRTDSLERELALKDMYLKNINMIIAGETPEQETREPDTTKDYTAIEFKQSEQDSLLRAMVEQEERFNIQNIQFGSKQAMEMNIRDLFFFAPLKGDITAGFDSKEKHFAVDIVAKENEPIKACLDGTIIFSSWTYDAGHVVAIQHSSNLTSFYKHCSVLLKKTGESIKAGEVVAIVGNSGELTTGPHLHFELWFNGRPVNPEDYIVF
ncbi:MAG: M23 family metallopeptidase [Flavobacteriales bacterium]|nr:M23 family metallopeptidase [Flavobacteriales bacterium]MCB9192642.1 M23 family metallopeptidase [Flavobacteriales bacterium]